MASFLRMLNKLPRHILIDDEREPSSGMSDAEVFRHPSTGVHTLIEAEDPDLSNAAVQVDFYYGAGVPMFGHDVLELLFHNLKPEQYPALLIVQTLSSDGRKQMLEKVDATDQYIVKGRCLGERVLCIHKSFQEKLDKERESK